MTRNIFTEKLTTPSKSGPLQSLLILLLVLGLPVFLLALLGIASRPIGSLAAIWPANAFLLGLMLRSRYFRQPAAWLMAFASLSFADWLSGSSTINNLALNTGNLLEVAAGVLFASRLPASWRLIYEKNGVFGMLATAMTASLTAGLVGAVCNPLLFGGPITEGWIYWSVTEFANYIAFLPVIMVAPCAKVLASRIRQGKFHIDVFDLLPGVTVILLCTAGIYIDGPAAVALPVIALVWCALRNSFLFTTVFTMLYCHWTLLALALGHLSVGSDLISWNAMMSWRLGITMVALVPILVAAYNYARQKELEQIKWAASHDSLTGALNRGAFFDRLNQAATDLNSQPLALLMMDLDHFKSINDQYGHPAGDKVLHHFVTIAESSLREGDTIGRLGGEEFAVLLQKCSDADLNTVARRINESLEFMPLILEGGEEIPVTVSIGATSALYSPIYPDELVHEADQALYAAKHSGRNRVVHYQEMDITQEPESH